MPLESVRRPLLPYFIAPRDDREQRYGKPCLLTNYELDRLVDALVKDPEFDRDLLLKLRILRNEHSG
jgi:hypothetical protein